MVVDGKSEDGKMELAGWLLSPTPTSNAKGQSVTSVSDDARGAGRFGECFDLRLIRTTPCSTSLFDQMDEHVACTVAFTGVLIASRSLVIIKVVKSHANTTQQDVKTTVSIHVLIKLRYTRPSVLSR